MRMSAGLPAILLKISMGPCPGSLKRRWAKYVWKIAKVARGGSVVDTLPRAGCGGMVADIPPRATIIDDSSWQLPRFPFDGVLRCVEARQGRLRVRSSRMLSHNMCLKCRLGA